MYRTIREPVVGYLVVEQTYRSDRYATTVPVTQGESEVTIGAPESGDTHALDLGDGEAVVGAFPVPPGLYRLFVLEEGREDFHFQGFEWPGSPSVAPGDRGGATETEDDE